MHIAPIAWNIAVPSLLTSGVEWVEAFTIVLAVSLSIGWRLAAGAALSALLVLAAMIAACGAALRPGASLAWLQGAIGVFLLLFGMRWLAKAIARGAGLRRLHDEIAAFAEISTSLAGAERKAAWLVAFKGVMLEGLEVWLIVVALGLPHGRAGISHWPSSAGGAVLALLLVAAAGLAIRAPLSRVPENSIKFLVGAMITSFGTFWTVEALGGDAAWPWGEWSLPLLALFYGIGGLLLMAAFRPRLAA